MKKGFRISITVIAVLIACTVIFIGAGAVFAAEETITLKLDGKVVQTEVPPIIISGRTMTPAKFLFEAMGGTVEWIAETQQVRVELSGTSVLLTIDSRTAQVNGQNKTMDVAPIIKNQRTLIPASFVARELGCGVTWINDTQTVEITSAQSDKAPNQDQDQNQNQNQDQKQGTAENELDEYEAQVAALVNEERAAAELPALTVNKELSQVAEKKAMDMRDHNYFSHTSPTYGSPFDMMKKFGITYHSAGENIARGQKTPQSVMDSWMTSQGHKENILNAKYTEIGIGYVTDSKGNTYWVQMFIRP